MIFLCYLIYHLFVSYQNYMKMELEIKAPASGKVHFLATAGTQLKNGQAVAQIN